MYRITIESDKYLNSAKLIGYCFGVVTKNDMEDTVKERTSFWTDVFLATEAQTNFDEYELINDYFIDGRFYTEEDEITKIYLKKPLNNFWMNILNIRLKEYSKLKNVVFNDLLINEIDDMNETLELFEKPVITKFVRLNDEEYEYHELLKTIDELMKTNIDDKYGDYSLRDYELSNLEIANVLVEMGYVNNYTGSRMANLYCRSNNKNLEILRNKLYDLE